jgi:hypothetical protein
MLIEDGYAYSLRSLLEKSRVEGEGGAPRDLPPPHRRVTCRTRFVSWIRQVFRRRPHPARGRSTCA